MRKIYLLFLVFFGLATGLSAQEAGSVLLNESFEGEVFPPLNWVQKNGTGKISWTVISEGDTNKVASFAGYGNMDELLVAPQLLPTADQNQFEFKVKSGYYNFAGMELKVLVSTGSNNIADFDIELLSLKSGAQTDTGIVKTWATHVVDLSAYVDQPIFVALQAKGYTSSTFVVDDVKGIPFAEFDNDLEVTSFTGPTDNPFIMENDEVEVSAVVTNNGNNAVADQVVTFYIDGASVASETISLAAGEQISITKTVSAGAGNKYISVGTPDDEFIANNTLGVDVMFYPNDALLESFEGAVFPPLYWTAEGNEKWKINTYSYITHGVQGATTYTPDFKLITPKLNVALGDSLCFDAYISGNFEIATSVDGINWESVEVITLTGVYESRPYTIHFNESENSEFTGVRYFSFSIVNGYGSIYMDKVYGPAVNPVSDDFELVDFGLATSDALYEKSEMTFEVTVENKGLSAAAKNISIFADETVITESLSTGELQPGESAIVSFAWTPDTSYNGAIFTAQLEADDYDGNNGASFEGTVYPADAMELPFATDFEDWTAGMPNFWAVTDTASTTWAIASGYLYSPSTSAHSGAAVLDFKAYNKKSKASLVTPNLNLTEDYYKVSFYTYRQRYEYYQDSLDQFSVYVSNKPVVDEDANFAGVINRSVIYEPVEANEGWQYYEFWADASDLEEGFIIFEGYSTGTYQNIYVDDLSITPASLLDANINSIIMPELVWGTKVVEQEISLSFTNIGANDITAATIEWSIDGVAQENIEYNETLAVNSTDTIALAAAALTTGATHTIEATIVIDGDTYAGNNTASSEIIVNEAYKLPYSIGFEVEDTTVEEWITIDADGDGYNWEIANENATEGEQLMRSASYIEADALTLTPDNWLISPAISVSADTMHISFEVGTTDEEYFEEKYEVLVSETNTDVEAFTPIYTETFTSVGFKTIDLELTAYKGKQVFVAFRHYDCTEQWFLNLDNIQFYANEYTVDFSVASNEVAMANAEITIVELDSTFATDAAGMANIALQDGVYNYTVAIEGYDLYEGAFEVDGAALSLAVEMAETKYAVEFNVAFEGVALENAEVTIAELDSTFATNAEGLAKIALVNGTYNFTVALAGYDLYQAAFDVAGETVVVNVELIETKYAVGFNVVSEGVALENAEVTIAELDSTFETNAEGVANIALVDGTYNYTVTLEGYDLFEGTVEVAGEALTVDVTLVETILYYNVTFNVSGNAGALADAEVTIAELDSTISTNAEGVATIALPDGAYTYTVTLDGFDAVDGDFDVAGAEVSIDVALIHTVVTNFNNSELKVYPNPFVNQINVRSDRAIESVSLYNATGAQILKQKATTVDATALRGGVYVLVVEYVNGEKAVMKVRK